MQLADRMNHLGTETAFEVLARANALAAQGRDIINLGIGQPDFQTPGNIVEAGRKALADGHHGYTPANGIPELRQAVADDIMKYRGATIDPEHVVIQPGGKPTMFYACLMFGEAGAEIMYPNPGFPIYESAIRFSGATPVPIELHEDTGFSFSADEVLEKVTERTRLIIINSPANPTGGVVQKDELDKLVAGLEQHPEVVILSDEIYSRMVYDNQPHISLLSYPSIRDRLILLDGWSKTYAMTGWRLGYAIWPEACAEQAARLCVNDHSCVNAATQWAGVEAVRGPQDAADAMVKAFDERREVSVDELNAIPGFRCVRPGGAFYAFPNIEGTGMTSSVLQEKMLNEAGVAAISGTSFGVFGEGYLRFSYANSTENIVAAMGRIRDLVAAQ
ncbi:MAG: pyridoxal phosphate-dependent aminotransferase [Alphaproteobacteria bacterium]|nr:pyridoxal phosphate-dependent aminotransferase [Alphaproteobacteria bacterium]